MKTEHRNPQMLMLLDEGLSSSFYDTESKGGMLYLLFSILLA